MKRISLILGVVLFVVLCVTASFWVMQLMKPETRKISAPPVPKPVADVESVAGLFGGALAMNTNYQLKGIVLANPANQSGAIIAVDGKPTQAFRINAEINPGVKLSEVHADYILILDNGISKRVDLPQELKASGQISEVANNAPINTTNSTALRAGQPLPPGVSPPMNNVRRRGIVQGNSMADSNSRMRNLQPMAPAPNNSNPNDPVNKPQPNQ